MLWSLNLKLQKHLILLMLLARTALLDLINLNSRRKKEATTTETEILKDEQEVTIDGHSGKVFQGASKQEEKEIKPVVKTKTEIKVIVDLPEYAEKSAQSKCTPSNVILLNSPNTSNQVVSNPSVALT